jgi:hypothetical protein
LSKAIQSIVLQHHGVQLSTIVLVSPRTIPKTTSGKIARSWVKKSYIEGTLKSLYRFDYLDQDSFQLVSGFFNLPGICFTFSDEFASSQIAEPEALLTASEVRSQWFT